MAFAGLSKYKAITSLGTGSDSDKDAMGGIGLRVMELGTHAVLALASKQTPNGMFGIEAIKPDWIGLAVSGLGVIFLRGSKHRKLRKTSRAVLFGSFHALITRWVATSEVPIPFLRGPEQSAAPQESKRKAA